MSVRSGPSGASGFSDDVGGAVMGVYLAQKELIAYGRIFRRFAREGADDGDGVCLKSGSTSPTT
jgi:hypothetical protein